MLLFWSVSMAVAMQWGGSTLQTDGWLPWLAGLALFVALACAGGLAYAWMRQPGSVRWDGQFWHWGPAHTAGQEPSSGSALLCIDLGFFVLIHLQPLDASRWQGVWWAVERRSHRGYWHVLRCALQPGSAG